MHICQLYTYMKRKKHHGIKVPALAASILHTTSEKMCVCVRERDRE